MMRVPALLSVMVVLLLGSLCSRFIPLLEVAHSPNGQMHTLSRGDIFVFWKSGGLLGCLLRDVAIASRCVARTPAYYRIADPSFAHGALAVYRQRRPCSGG